MLKGTRMHAADGSNFEYNMGVPQGGVLSPALFALYMHCALRTQLTEAQLEENVIAFADDLLIYANSQNQLEFILSRVTLALRNHNMYLAKEKSQLIRNRMVTKSSISGIKQIPVMKYLGVGITASQGRLKSSVETIFRKAFG
jgi:hypothetical protein